MTRQLPLIVALLLAGRASAAPSGERIALTLTGGVSLGAYEAGLAWTTVRLLRSDNAPLPPGELVALTGASAGGVNALLAAAFWCEDDGEHRDDSVDDNLFLLAWPRVGLGQLLPDDPSAYGPEDGVLAGAPLERVLELIRSSLDAPRGRRYRPGCSIPVGLTVTRTEPEVRDVSGIQVRGQRFVVPLLFDVDLEGRPRLLRAPLTPGSESAASALHLGESEDGTVNPLQASNAVLASGAFPFAFGPRELCDCALECPLERTVTDGQCPGPDRSHPLSGLSCAKVPPAGERKLCRRSYVDGGIFDNAPVGLAIDLVESTVVAPPLRSITYALYDPDFRRLSPFAASASDSSEQAGISGSMQVLASLIATARTSQLSRAISADDWNRTTRTTLDRAAALVSRLSDLQNAAARAGGEVDAQAKELSLVELTRGPTRDRVGRRLYDCLRQLHASSYGNVALLSRCASDLRSGVPQAGGAARLEVSEVIQVSRWLFELASVNTSPANRDRPSRTLRDPGSTRAARLRAAGVFRNSALIGMLAFRYLDEEVERVARADIDLAKLRAFRSNLLGPVLAAGELARTTEALLRTLAPDLEPGSEWHPGGGGLEPLLRKLIEEGDRLARSTEDLIYSGAPERALVISRRFSPLAASPLFNFTGFLDRSLREADFYIGVYDASWRAADVICTREGPYSPARTTPEFREDKPLELDERSEATQRCIGEALRDVVESLSLSSPRARWVIGHLARLELAAALDDSGAAQRLAGGPSWSWLPPQQAALAGDPVAVVVETLTSQKRPCLPQSREALCLADLSFDELLTGLNAKGFRATDDSMRDALAGTTSWASGLAAKVAARSAAIELENARKRGRVPDTTVLVVLGATQGWAHRTRLLGTAPRFHLDSSSIPFPAPREASPYGLLVAHLLPYRVSFDVAHGGIALSWLEPQLRLTRWFSISALADVVDIYWTKGHGASTLGVLPTVSLGTLALSVGPRWSIRWTAGTPATPGLHARIAVLQERLAISTGVSTLRADKREWFFTVGFSDVNGLAYWLNPWASASR